MVPDDPAPFVLESSSVPAYVVIAQSISRVQLPAHYGGDLEKEAEGEAVGSSAEAWNFASCRNADRS